MSADIEITYSGPIFSVTNQAGYWTDQACRDMEHIIGRTGALYVDVQLDAVLKTQTPYYRLQVTSTEYPGRTVINDGGVVYGPWLEGTSSRNKTTRFKGYSTFRKVTRMLNQDAKRIVLPRVNQLVDKINHGS